MLNRVNRSNDLILNTIVIVRSCETVGFPGPRELHSSMIAGAMRRIMYTAKRMKAPGRRYARNVQSLPTARTNQ
jgi:hypothetical protein